MKEYTVKIPDDTALFYEEISRLVHKEIEEILEETLLKTAEMIVRAIPDD